ncbi:wings apart-like protein regulation of heterochromatin-domain-containing protein [Lipomyces chichibuensis]|uniref:wings apart-like protein regulation of heterochromatin-domain-containing protein n=1 Tax=Lipomyces chichibuensis TaxID=1546026 RepID=UPI00334416C5
MSSASSAFSRRTPVTTTYGRRKQAPSTPITPTTASPVRKSRPAVEVGERASLVSEKDEDVNDSITVESPVSAGGTGQDSMRGLTGQIAKTGGSSSFVPTPSRATDRGSPRKRKRRSPTDIVPSSVDEELTTGEVDIFEFSGSEIAATSTSKPTAPSTRKRSAQKRISQQPAVHQKFGAATSPVASVEEGPAIPLKSSPFKIVVPITKPSAESSSVVDEGVTSPPAPSTPLVPIPVSTRRLISPPPLEDLEFDDPAPASPAPRTPSSTGSPSKWRPSPRLTTRQSEAWKVLDQVTGTVSASKAAQPCISGSGSGKLFKALSARKDSGSKSLSMSLRIKEAAQNVSSQEDEATEETQSVGDSQDAQHMESQSQRQSFSSQLIRGGKITYGSQRSYLEETASATETSGKQTSISELSDIELLRSGMLGGSSASTNAPLNRRPRSILRQNSSSEDEDVPGEGELRAIKSIHELRASGVNAKFIDEMEYLLDGLQRDSRQSAARLTYLELALKLTDKSFVIKFKAGGFLDRIFRSIKEMTKSGSDDVTSFAMEYIACCFLSDEGVAQSLVNEYGVVPFLIGMVSDGREIMTVAKQRSTGLSKVAQSLVKELRDKIVSLIPNDGDMCRETVSRRFIALTGLLELSSKYGPRHETIHAELSSNSLWMVTLGGVRDILGPGDKPMSIAAAHELHLGVSILEDFAESVIAAKGHGSEYDESDTCAVVERLLKLIPQMIDTPAETGSLATLRLSIIITNSSPQACENLCIDSVVLGLETCIERVLMDAPLSDSDTQADYGGDGKEEEAGHEDEDYGVAPNIALFCLGLLVNFSESESARQVLTHASHVTTILRLFTLATSTPVKPLSQHSNLKKSYIEDIRGYLALLIGILLLSSTAVRAQIGVAGVAAIGRELEIFRESTMRLQQESGIVGSRGLAEQIRSVLVDVYSG